MDKKLQVCIVALQIGIMLMLLILLASINGCSTTNYWRKDTVPEMRFHTKALKRGMLYQSIVISNPTEKEITGLIECTTSVFKNSVRTEVKVKPMSDQIVSLMLPNFSNDCSFQYR